jgi:hypothetical protein
MEFFMRYGSNNSVLCDSLATTDSDISFDNTDGAAVSLPQDSDFWVGSWLFDLAQSEERLITVSNSSGGITPEFGFTLAASSGDSFEIWDLWPPSDIHAKMNMTLRNSWRIFPNIVNAESIIMQEGLVRYGLIDSDLTQPDLVNPSIAYVLQMFIEKNNRVIRGQVSSTGAAGLTFTDASFPYDSDDEVDSDYLLSIYAGPGAGTLRQLNTVDSNLLFTVDTDYAASDALTTDSKYAMWDPTTDAQEEWYRLTAVRFGAMEYPDYFELRSLYPSAYGMRFRITYVENTTDLTVESAFTTVPEEYMAFKSLSMLYDELVGDNRHDRASHAGLAEYYDQLAQAFVQQNRRTLPAATLWQEQDLAGGGWADVIDPLGWRD